MCASVLRRTRLFLSGTSLILALRKYHVTFLFLLGASFLNGCSNGAGIGGFSKPGSMNSSSVVRVSVLGGDPLPQVAPSAKSVNTGRLKIYVMDEDNPYKENVVQEVDMNYRVPSVAEATRIQQTQRRVVQRSAPQPRVARPQPKRAVAQAKPAARYKKPPATPPPVIAPRAAPVVKRNPVMPAKVQTYSEVGSKQQKSRAVALAPKQYLPAPSSVYVSATLLNEQHTQPPNNTIPYSVQHARIAREPVKKSYKKRARKVKKKRSNKSLYNKHKRKIKPRRSKKRTKATRKKSRIKSKTKRSIKKKGKWKWDADGRLLKASI